MVALISSSAGLGLRADPIANISHSLIRSLDGSKHQPQQVPYRLAPTVLMNFGYWRDKNKEFKWP